MKAEELIILPCPRELNKKSGCFVLKQEGYISIPDEDKQEMFSLAKRLQQLLKSSFTIDIPITLNQCKQQWPGIIFEKEAGLPKEAYILDIRTNGIYIGYGDCAGAFYAVGTLKQLILQCGKLLPCLEIKDEPDFQARGIMLDISRNKIPKMETLFKMVDFMADLKLNQLQLYIEGFSFAYPSFPEVWNNNTPVTGEEIMLLDRYCAERFIELVPNQNSFGHMTPWLSREEFKDLAECSDGFNALWGWYDKPFSLNPQEPKCIEFLQTTYDDLLPYFSSGMFNVGCDETFDLGQGKSRQECESKGRGRVYLDFFTKIYHLVKKRGKKMMFWGDIILHYPDLIPELPKDIIALEWGYMEEEPSLEHCRMFMGSGIPYYVCPGTYSWNSITGFTERTKKNLLNAAKRGKACDATGYLITDWGDGGHWQPLPVSYQGFCYGAALCWGVEQNENVDTAVYLNKFIFKDKNNRMGKFVLDLGNYYLREPKTEYDGSGIFRTLRVSQLTDKNTDLDFLHLPDLSKEDFESVKEYVSRLADELDVADMQCKDADIIAAEFKNAIRLILHGADLGLFKLEKRRGDQERLELKKLLDDLTSIIKEYKEIWLKRNRSGGLEDSIARMEELKSQYTNALLFVR